MSEERIYYCYLFGAWQKWIRTKEFPTTGIQSRGFLLWNLFNIMKLTMGSNTYLLTDISFLLSTAVGQAVACAPVTQRARVRSPVGTSFLGEVFRCFSSPVRQMSGSFRPQGPRISFDHRYHYHSSFITGANDLGCWRAHKPQIYIRTVDHSCSFPCLNICRYAAWRIGPTCRTSHVSDSVEHYLII